MKLIRFNTQKNLPYLLSIIFILAAPSFAQESWSQGYKIVFQKFEDNKPENYWEVWRVNCDFLNLPRKNKEPGSTTTCHLLRIQIFCIGGLSFNASNYYFNPNDKNSDQLVTSLGKNHVDFTIRGFQPNLKCHLTRADGPLAATEGRCHGSDYNDDKVVLTELRKVDRPIIPNSCIKGGIIP